MTAQPFMPPSLIVGTPRKSMPPTQEPATALESALAPDRSFIARLWHAYCARRNAARLRNIAQDMEPHMLSDVGAPQWLVNEVTVRRELTRLRNADYIRW